MMILYWEGGSQQYISFNVFHAWRHLFLTYSAEYRSTQRTIHIAYKLSLQPLCTIQERDSVPLGDDWRLALRGWVGWRRPCSFCGCAAKHVDWRSMDTFFMSVVRGARMPLFALHENGLSLDNLSLVAFKSIPLLTKVLWIWTSLCPKGLGWQWQVDSVHWVLEPGTI